MIKQMFIVVLCSQIFSQINASSPSDLYACDSMAELDKKDKAVSVALASTAKLMGIEESLRKNDQLEQEFVKAHIDSASNPQDNEAQKKLNTSTTNHYLSWYNALDANGGLVGYTRYLILQKTQAQIREAAWKQKYEQLKQQQK